MLKILALLFFTACSVTPIKEGPLMPAPTVTNSIYIIGDSHSDFYDNARGSFGFFGQHLQELLPGSTLVALSSAIPSWYVDGHANLNGCTVSPPHAAEKSCTTALKVADISQGVDLLVIELGTNLIGYSEAQIKAEMQKFLAQVKSKRCLWVSPPNVKAHTQSQRDLAQRVIKQNVGKCEFFDSTFFPFEARNSQDNEHLSQAASAKWAQAVAKVIRP